MGRLQAFPTLRHVLSPHCPCGSCRPTSKFRFSVTGETNLSLAAKKFYSVSTHREDGIPGWAREGVPRVQLPQEQRGTDPRRPRARGVLTEYLHSPRLGVRRREGPTACA